MIKQDLVEAVIGLGKNLFFGSGMECCLVVCRKNKPLDRQGKVLFIDAKDEIRLERSEAFLKEKHIERIKKAYLDYIEEEAFSKVVNTEDILENNNGNLSIQLYVKKIEKDEDQSVNELISKSALNQDSLQKGFSELINKLNDLGIETL